STITCVASQCAGACAAGYADCDSDKQTDGCEVLVGGTDLNNCGGCGLVCSNQNIASPVCTAGACTGSCNAGYTDCDGNKQSNGCEANTASNPNTCGGCTNVCSPMNITTRTCTAGVCTGACNSGYADCNSNK